MWQPRSQVPRRTWGSNIIMSALWWLLESTPLRGDLIDQDQRRGNSVNANANELSAISRSLGNWWYATNRTRKQETRGLMHAQQHAHAEGILMQANANLCVSAWLPSPGSRWPRQTDSVVARSSGCLLGRIRLEAGEKRNRAGLCVTSDKIMADAGRQHPLQVVRLFAAFRSLKSRGWCWLLGLGARLRRLHGRHYLRLTRSLRANGPFHQLQSSQWSPNQERIWKGETGRDSPSHQAAQAVQAVIPRPRPSSRFESR